MILFTNAYTKDLCGYAERGEKEWKRLLGSFFAEGVNIAVVKNDEGQIEGYAVYRLGAPEIPVTEFVYTTRRAHVVCLIIFITIVLKVKAFAGMKGCMIRVIDLFLMEKQVIQRCRI